MRLLEAIQIIESAGMRVDERELTPEQRAARRARARARRDRMKLDNSDQSVKSKRPKRSDYSSKDDYNAALFDYLGRVVSPDDLEKETGMDWRFVNHVIVEYGVDVRDALENKEDLYNRSGYFWLSDKENKDHSAIKALLNKKFGEYGWYRVYFYRGTDLFENGWGERYYYNPAMQKYKDEILPRREAEEYLKRGEIPSSIKYNGQGFSYTNPVYTEFCKLPGAKPLLDARAKEEEKRKEREKDNIWWNGRGDFLKEHPEASST
jgi:hypothetical protein